MTREVIVRLLFNLFLFGQLRLCCVIYAFFQMYLRSIFLHGVQKMG